MGEEPIRVWPFDCAPDEYRLLTPHGGDEDWLAFVPDRYSDEILDWLASGSAFGCCETSEHPVFGGTVYIGAHA